MTPKRTKVKTRKGKAAKRQAHSIDVIIKDGGQIETTVQGVAGPDCGPLTAWLEEMGEVLSDDPTDDHRKKPPKQRVRIR